MPTEVFDVGVVPTKVFDVVDCLAPPAGCQGSLFLEAGTGFLGAASGLTSFFIWGAGAGAKGFVVDSVAFSSEMVAGVVMVSTCSTCTAAAAGVSSPCSDGVGDSVAASPFFFLRLRGGLFFGFSSCSS
jgi:hypothetical protein